MSAERIRRQLEISGSTAAAPALIVQDGGSCLGVVARRPNVSKVAVGLGPFVRPDDLVRSDRTAREALRLARHLGRQGVHSAAELGWRLAAVGRRDVWTDYYERFVQPVLAEGEFGQEILAGARCWIENGRSISRTAEALRIHVNTVRYRMARYVELTGADLVDPDDLIGIRWAIELGNPEEFFL